VLGGSGISSSSDAYQLLFALWLPEYGTIPKFDGRKIKKEAAP
jgi:hypothetical protein